MTRAIALGADYFIVKPPWKYWPSGLKKSAGGERRNPRYIRDEVELEKQVSESCRG